MSLWASDHSQHKPRLLRIVCHAESVRFCEQTTGFLKMLIAKDLNGESCMTYEIE